jgi:hypothetical protein
MFDDSCFSGEVTDFRKLGTGHKRKRVFVVDQNRRRILFVTRVLQNRPCIGELRFENRRVFSLRFQTLGNQKVLLFHWSEELERRWLSQCEMDKIERWLETAEPEDVIVLAEFVAEESGFPKTTHFPIFAAFAKQEIKKRLKYLSFVQLQKLAGMLFSVPEQIAA